MSRRTMSKGGMTKGQKGARRQGVAQPVPPPTMLNNKEHNNNTKANPNPSQPQQQPHQSSVPTSNNKPAPPTKTTTSSSFNTAKVLKDKNSSPPSAPSSSPIPIPPPEVQTQTQDASEQDDDPELDVEELDVGVEIVEDDDDDDDDEDCEDEEVDEDEEGDDDDDEYDNDTEPCDRGGRTHQHHPAKNLTPNSNNIVSCNSPLFPASSSEEDDEDEGEGEDSLDRDESDDEDEEDEDGLEPPGFLLNADGDPSSIQGIPPDAQARLEAFFEAAGFTDGKLMSDPENLRKLTLTVSSALGEASAAINRMRDSQRKSIEEGRNDSMEEGDSLLALACSSGYYELARVLLAMGANVDDRGSKGDLTPLMDAASQGHLEIVKLLISHGAEVNAQSACGNSPLMYSAAAGHEDIVRELLKAGARVEDNNENGHTPLMESASSGHVGVAKILLENGAGINTSSNEFKESALTVACYKGHLEMVRFLLAAGADQQHKTDEMHTALMEASMDGHVEVAKLLLDCGAQVNMPVDSFESPLTLAACGGHVELAQLLIDRGANIEEVNDEGYTPLMEAAREGHIQVVKCLIAAGSKVNAETDETHETALTLSACGGFLEVVSALVEKGADIELGASTPLMEASQEGHYQVVKYLMDKNAQIHRETPTGDTALSYACENGHVDVVRLLIENGANPEHLSEGGRTPLMKACRGGHAEVIKFLLTKNVNVNRQTASNDHTPLSLASAGGHLAAVEVLLAKGADRYHKLKDNSTMVIEAARGGHTNVMKVLLDHADSDSETNGPPQTKGPTKGTVQSKGQSIDSSKTGANASNQQGKSVLRKSRSTSTLDSSQSNQSKTQKMEPTASKTKATSAGDSKLSKLPPHIMTSIPADSPILKTMNQQNLPLVDGKITLANTEAVVTAFEESRKKPVPPSVAKQQVGAQQQKSSGAILKPATASQVQSQNQANICVECNNSAATVNANIAVPSPAAVPKTPEQPHVVTKRAAADASVISPAGSATSSTSSPASTTTSPGGPPLVPSQVTAATAISERPKAKANKPSARKQVQLQQQIQQQLQQQSQSQLSAASSSGSGSGGGIVNPSSNGGSGAVAVGVAANGGIVAKAASVPIALANTNPSPPPSSMQQYHIPGLPSQMLQMQVQQIFTQHQSQLVYPGDRTKFECFEGVGSALAYDSIEMAADFAQVLAAAGNYPQSQSSVLPPPPGTTTTTTTTTVVVTHGNGETETIIEGEHLIPGANEMIMSAAAAAFPLDCYTPVVGVAGAGNTVGGAVQVQSYQLSSPLNVNVGVGVVGGELPLPPALTTTTMHTTTIINSANGNFPPQILLPRHPPPLPAAFSEAAAAAGLVPPSGAPPVEGILKQPQVQKPITVMTTKSTRAAAPGQMAQAQTQTQPPPPMLGKDGTKPVPPVKPLPAQQQQQTLSAAAAAAIPKKQTAKRTRPFSQGPQTGQGHHGPCPNNHKGCTGHQAVGTQTPGGGAAAAVVDKNAKALDVDSATESNGETSLSIAAGQGHLEVVEFLLERQAHIEHRDKKGCTPLILAADGGHEKVVENLLNHGADLEAQSERTKDTALSLACTKGRYEVVELLLKRGANKEHRNVSDYTPLSLAASGGFVNIIKLLLQSGAEINSRTGSKLGISPLMLAAMNGNTAAVKLLLDMGSDINAQIETNKNTALTLACFQGRHEVVQLLLDRKANLEHRAKTGLTPLMEAANGGYVEVGKVLIEKGADVNAPPVPATRDTALTIAADKGHFRFVEMLIACNANVDVRNKKGCTPLWLACNGGHLDVCQALQRARADVDAQDNRRISCLMASFKKGHVKVVRWIVKYVKQFPGDTEMSRYFLGLANEAELLKRAQQCMDIIKQAKDKQALEASKNANILLEELELEKSREESKKLAAAKRREKKKKKKQEKKQVTGNEDDREADNEDEDDNENDVEDAIVELMDSGVELNSVGSNSSSLVDKRQQKGQKGGKGNKENVQVVTVLPVLESTNIRKQQMLGTKAKEPEPLPTTTIESSRAKETTESSSNQKHVKKKKSSKVSKSSSSEAVIVDAVPISTAPISTNSAAEPSSKSTPFETSSSSGKKSSSGIGKAEKEVLKEKVKEVESSDFGVGGKSKSSKERKNKENAEEKKNLKVEESHHHHLHTSSIAKELSLNAKGSNITLSKKGKPSSSDLSSAIIQGQGPEPLMNISLNPPHSHPGRNKGGGVGIGGSFDHEVHAFAHYAISSPATTNSLSNIITSPSSSLTGSTAPISNKSPGGVGVPGLKPTGRKDDGWKEVTRSCPSSRSKKVMVPSSVISRVIGRGGCNINAIREATNAHIEVEKQQKGAVQPERSIQIKGTVEATKQAYSLITALMNEPDVDIKKLIPVHTRGGSSTGGTSSSSNGSSTPTPVLNSVNAFPVIGSASAPLPPIGQPMTIVGGPSSSSSISISSSAPSNPMVIGSTAGVAESKSFSNKKGSPTQISSSSVSPPLSYMKSGSGSPPIKKPSVLPSSIVNAGNFEIGNFSVSEVPAEIYSKSYIGKKSMVFTNSGNNNGSSNNTNTSSASNSSSSFTGKLDVGSNWGDVNVKPRNTTSINSLNLSDMKPTNPIAAPFSSSTAATVPCGSPPLLSANQRQQHGQASALTHGHNQQGHHQHSQNFGHKEQDCGRENNQFGSGLNAHVHVNGPSKGNVGGDSFHPGSGRNLAPGPAGPIGSNRSNIGTERSPSEASNNQDQSQPQPLEYTPFSYTFSKTTEWFPGDLAVREHSSHNQQHASHAGNFGVSNLISSLAAGGSTSALSSAARMNFASVAASGISSSMSTTTAQMTTAGGVNGGGIAISAIGKPLMGDGPLLQHPIQHQHPLQNQVHQQVSHQQDGQELHKADASKAPGYRGNTSMGSPVMRMPHPQANPQQLSNPHDSGRFNLDLSPLNTVNPSHPNNVMHFNARSSGPNYNSGNPGGQYQPQDMGLINSQQPVNGGNHMMYQQQQNSRGTPSTLPVVQSSGPPPHLLPIPQTQLSHPRPPLPTHVVVNTNPPPPVPTNVVLSSRLNPRAPSFTVKVAPGGQQPPLSIGQQHQTQLPNSINVNSAFASTHPPPPQQQQNPYMAQFKGLGVHQGQGYGGQQQQQQSRRLGSTWAGYSNGSIEDFQTLSGLAAPAGIMDPASLIGGLDNMHDNQNSMKVDDRRLPRPIGGERTWKGSSGSSSGHGGGGNLPFTGMEGLEPPPSNWLGMYGSSNQQQQGFPSTSNQGIAHPRGGGDRSGGVNVMLGRRYMDDIDTTRILEYQQMYDGQQRIMNGGNGPPMIHMQNSLPQPHPASGIFPFGVEHMEQQQQQQHAPKLDPQWDAHLMDDKHLQQGWGGKWGN